MSAGTHHEDIFVCTPRQKFGKRSSRLRYGRPFVDCGQAQTKERDEDHHQRSLHSIEICCRPPRDCSTKTQNQYIRRSKFCFLILLLSWNQEANG